MRRRIPNDLLLIVIFTVILIIIVSLLEINILRIVLGLAFLLFFPGYVLLSAMFPGKSALSGIERIALGFGLSLVIIGLVGLILNYTPWGIRIYPVLIALTVFIVVTSIIAWWRRQRLNEEERFIVSFTLNVSPWKSHSPLERVLSIILLVAILGVAATLGYAVAVPKVAETFTEFYLLGPEGKLEGYPDKVKVGEEAGVILVIVNHERKAVSYRIDVTLGGTKYTEIGPLLLDDEEKSEQEVKFVPKAVAKNQKLEFILYKDGETYRRTYLFIDVTS